jgi:RNA polymerase sigma factor (sigma-70 family)
METSQPTIAVDQLAQGNAETWEAMLKWLLPRLLSFLYSRQQANPLDVEDVAQVVLIDIYRNLPRFLSQAKASDRPVTAETIGRWAFLLARRRMSDYVRHRAQRSGYEQPIEFADQVVAPELTSPALRSREQTVSLLTDAVAKLPDEDRQLVELVANGTKTSEIARLLKISVPTVRRRLARTAARLSSQLREVSEVPVK